MTMRGLTSTVLVWLVATAGVSGQEQRWAADLSAGYAGFVDDATKGYTLVGGALRRYISARVSIGPEIVVMNNSALLRDRAVMLTGNVSVDLASAPVIPFVVGGVGAFWSRDLVRGGPYWSSDPAFTGGGGIRVVVARRVAVAAEYRIGWELHQRVSGTLIAEW